MFLGQSVPVVKTGRGYGLFCEVCELGHGAITVRAADARKLQLRLDPSDAFEGSEEE
jgi:hypothetical protein